MPYTVNEPIPFPGTPEQASINYWTHNWDWADGDIRCWNCDAKTWHAAASYPCGEQPPRHDVVYEDNEVTAQERRFAIAAALHALSEEGS